MKMVEQEKHFKYFTKDDPPFRPHSYWNLCSEVQSKNNAYHIVIKIQNSIIDALILSIIDMEVCVVFALYSSLR